MEGNKDFSKGKAYRIPIIIAIILGLILFLPAGSIMYWEAWIFWFETFALTIFYTAYFLKKDPKLLERRNQIKEKEPQPGFMRVFSFLYMIGYLIPGFDYRFHWSVVPVWTIIAADVMIFFGYVLIFFVFKENSYASTIIQVEKEQQVITTGPYAMVRHPMYTAVLLISLFTPLALDSYWALITFILIIPMFVYRMINEEKLLLRDLPGYKDYCAKTRYRLIPLIW